METYTKKQPPCTPTCHIKSQQHHSLLSLKQSFFLQLYQRTNRSDSSWSIFLKAAVGNEQQINAPCTTQVIFWKCVRSKVRKDGAEKNYTGCNFVHVGCNYNKAIFFGYNWEITQKMIHTQRSISWQHRMDEASYLSEFLQITNEVRLIWPLVLQVNAIWKQKGSDGANGTKKTFFWKELKHEKICENIVILHLSADCRCHCAHSSCLQNKQISLPMFSGHQNQNQNQVSFVYNRHFEN